MTKEDAIKVKHLIDNIHNLDQFLDLFRFEHSTTKTKTPLSDEIRLSDNVLNGGLRKEILSIIKVYKNNLEKELNSFIPNEPKFIPGESIEPTYLKPLTKNLCDEFAINALSYLVAHTEESIMEGLKHPEKVLAKRAYIVADAMMKEREK